MSSTPAHDFANPDLLSIMPATARRVIEVGCSSGALAREYKKRNPQSHYVGIEIEAEFRALAARHCDRVEVVDIETVADADFPPRFEADCWVFGDSLEHLRDPWRVLRNIRSGLPAHGCVALCVPNAQHWSVQARLCAGLFRYEEAGLLDRTHLRWFTRITLLETVRACGFRVDEMHSRIFDEPNKDRCLPHLRSLARAIGVDADQAVQDALPLQYVLRIVPEGPTAAATPTP